MEWNVYIETFLAWPLMGRTACVVFVVAVVLGLLFGKYILRLLSVIPLLLGVIFQGLYIVVESLMDLLHKKYGGGFYDIENNVSRGAEKAYDSLQRWRGCWGNAKQTKVGWVLLICFAIVLYTAVVPVLAGSLDAPIAGGGRAYLQCEGALVNWMKGRGLYKAPEEIAREAVFMRTDSAAALKEGLPVKLAASPILENGRPSVPVRSTVEGALGGTVGWDEETERVVIQQGQTVVELSTGTMASVNGVDREFSYTPVEIDSKIYVDAGDFFGLFNLYAYWYEEEGLLAICNTPGGRFGPLTLRWVQEQTGG